MKRHTGRLRIISIPTYPHLRMIISDGASCWSTPHAISCIKGSWLSTTISDMTSPVPSERIVCSIMIISKCAKRLWPAQSSSTFICRETWHPCLHVMFRGSLSVPLNCTTQRQRAFFRCLRERPKRNGRRLSRMIWAER